MDNLTQNVPSLRVPLALINKLIKKTIVHDCKIRVLVLCKTVANSIEL